MPNGVTGLTGAPTSDIAGCRVLVTGASGFIGDALCRALVAAGAEVHGSTRGATPASSHDRMRWWRCDPADQQDAATLVQAVAPQVIYHLSAAVTGSRERSAVLPTLRDNLLSTIHLLLAASAVGVDRVVLGGSVEAWSEAGAPPRSPYAASKAAATAYAKMFDALYHTRCVDLRIAMTYGPGQRDASKLVPYVIEEVRAGRSPLLRDGSRLADWTYIDDVVAGLLAAATHPGALGRSIEIGTGVTRSVREVVERIVALVDPTVQPRFGAMEARPFELERATDLAPARELLGWAPRIALDDGIRRTVAAVLERAVA
jgi:UDP-glucose 4-epimerase